MLKVLLGTIVLSCTVFLAPYSAAAQSKTFPENLCAPIDDTQSDEESWSAALDYPRDYAMKIDLLENGINPGFTSVPEIDKAQLMESVAQFQAVNDLPVTGHLDERTLAKLNIRNPKSDPASPAVERAKPSK